VIKKDTHLLRNEELENGFTPEKWKETQRGEARER
jgi:hypothetical protein